MNALLVINRQGIENCRVLVQVTENKLKEKIISLLEENKGEEAFELLFKKAEVKAYYPEGVPSPEIPQLITLDEKIFKSKTSAELSADCIPKKESVCYTQNV